MTDSRQGTVQTVDTPDGPFTLVVDDQGRVLGSGWTTDRQAVLDRIHRDIRPVEIAEERRGPPTMWLRTTQATLAVIMSTPVAQQGTDMQLRGWSALRRIPPGQPLSYTDFAALVGSPGACGRRRRSAPGTRPPCSFLPSRAAWRRQPGRIRVGNA